MYLKRTLLWTTILSPNPCPMLRYVHNDQWMQRNCNRWHNGWTGHNTVHSRFSVRFHIAWQLRRCGCGWCWICDRIASRWLTWVIVVVDFHAFICCCYRHHGINWMSESLYYFLPNLLRRNPNYDLNTSRQRNVSIAVWKCLAYKIR